MSIAYLKRYSNGKNFSFLKRGAVCSYLGLEERMRTKRFWSLITGLSAVAPAEPQTVIPFIKYG